MLAWTRSFPKGTRKCILAAEPIWESLFSEKELSYKVFIGPPGDEI